jgi:hypothetical protein
MANKRSTGDNAEKIGQPVPEEKIGRAADDDAVDASDEEFEDGELEDEDEDDDSAVGGD